MEVADLRTVNPFPTLPQTVALELSSACRLACRYCDRRNWTRLGIERRRPFLDVDLYHALVEELSAAWPRPALTLSFEGESALHPDFSAMLAFAAEHGFRPWISTSLVGVDETALAAMAEHSGTISVSLDGLEGDFLRQRGKAYSQVTASLERLIELSAARPARPRLSVTMVTEGAHHVGPNSYAFLERWLPLVDEAHLFEELRCAEGIRVPPSAGLHRHLARRRRCHQPFAFLAVLSDGRLCPCCTTSRVRFPDLHAGVGLQAAINSVEYQEFLARHRHMNLDGTACATCEGWIEGWLAGNEGTVAINERAAKTQGDGLGLHITGLRGPTAHRHSRGSLPSLGIGTRAGWGQGGLTGAATAMEEGTANDAACLVEMALCSGLTLFDTSPEFGDGTTQAALGAALADALSRGLAHPDDLFLVGRVGRLPPPAGRGSYLSDSFAWPELCSPDEVLPGQRCFGSRWVQESIRRSLADLRVARIDLMLLQAPEWLLMKSGPARGRELRRLISTMEEERSRGRVGAYGISSHIGLLSTRNHRLHVEIEEFVQAAREVAGSSHGLRAAAVPLNLETVAAAVEPRQEWAGRPVSLLDAIREAELDLIAAAPLGRGRLVRSLPAGTIEETGRTYTPAQWLIQFVRSLPGVSCTVFGTSRCSHVIEATAVLADPPWSADTIKRIAL